MGASNNPHAQALSALGASKGRDSARQSLSARKRKEIVKTGSYRAMVEEIK
jgi:hypothetical protein